MAEAIRREPDLAEAHTPDDFKRLNDAVAALQQEHQLRAELDQLRASHEHADRMEHRALAQAQARELKEQQQEAAATAEIDRLAKLPPTRRWIAQHRPMVTGVLVGAACLGLVTLGFLIPGLNSNPERATSATATGSPPPTPSSTQPSTPERLTWELIGCLSESLVAHAAGRSDFDTVDFTPSHGNVSCRYSVNGRLWGTVQIFESDDDYTWLLNGAKEVSRVERPDLGWKAVVVEYEDRGSDGYQGCVVQAARPSGDYILSESVASGNNNANLCEGAENLLNLAARRS